MSTPAESRPRSIQHTLAAPLLLGARSREAAGAPDAPASREPHDQTFARDEEISFDRLSNLQLNRATLAAPGEAQAKAGNGPPPTLDCCSPAIAPRPVLEDAEPANITWAQAAGRPEIAVALDHLPQSVRLGDTFPEPIRYDADQKQLVYRGFMSASSYRYLNGLSTDLAFMAALEDLSLKTALAVAPAPPRSRAWMWIVAIAIVAATAVAMALLKR